MDKRNFTASVVRGFQCPRDKQQAIYWDAKQPGLGLRVTKAGAKSYIFETRINGRTMRTTIGSPEAWPLNTQWRIHSASGERIEHQRGAREEAARLKTLTDQGSDPRELERKQREEAEAARIRAQAEATRDALRVSDAWASYRAQHKKHWGTRHMADHVNLSQPGGVKKKRGDGLTVPGVLYPLLQMRMVDVNAEALTHWQTREAEARPNNARQGFELFRAFWRWCATCDEYRSILDAQAVESKALRAEVPSRKSKRFDVLQRAYLPSWFAAVRGLASPTLSTYLQALLLTGARREEMAALRWEEVDFKWGSLWLKDKVAAEGRKIPLTPYLASLLANLKRINETPPKVKRINGAEVVPPWKSSEWVFFSRAAASGRVTEPRVAHNRALSVAGLEHVTLHGLRRTFASLAEWVEMPRGVVAQIMGHAPTATAERHYIDRPLELLAVWHRKYEAWILEQAGIAFESEPTTSKLRAVEAA